MDVDDAMGDVLRDMASLGYDEGAKNTPASRRPTKQVFCNRGNPEKTLS
jgi:hypothetical protein